ncbi:2-polyprenyl-3-methyl-5-hydroxy-6-metoxy-1,4-benzoquinol methylase [Paenibacillus anaericanus]|uniref:class I SAM-dependent methyltransferase n=1 Tax=Paenibacillus anaericanus TaxID=170367 RepID=UPI002781146E|nr:class I SAM-dependent methyltransferase [Paenibacillus anaericanus]MDQ0090756.1 2-polyprenyl-3-methyl-5-hydroxy-6-metoxy-1,4-benzoquinol methylase [Paenibacillus anaericanus]
MNNVVVNYYDNYSEEDRLGRDNVRRLEFITTTTILNKYIVGEEDILDVAAGTGIYSFYYADKVNTITATDITPKHIQIMQSKINHMGCENMKAEVVDATDLSMFDSESFDVVLCLGPMYHLQDIQLQRNCISECMRVLRTNGILAVAYINRFFTLPYMFKMNTGTLSNEWITGIIEDGCIHSVGDERFLASAYFHTPDEIEALLTENKVEKLEHVAIDGIGALMQDTINQLSDEKYNQWVEAHLRTCSEPSILGNSNHGMIVCRKM